MKKLRKLLFNNSGITLVEVIVAAIILSIIAVPILDTFLQTTKINISTDVEIKMKAETERIIEEVKAVKGDITLAGQPYGRDYVGGVYFDRLFKDVSVSGGPPYYKLTADKTEINTIDTNGEYDRWDFRIGVKKFDSTRSEVFLYNNKESRLAPYSSAGGKLFEAEQLSQGTDASMSLDFIGKTSDPYKLTYTIGGTTYPEKIFIPGTNRGAINSNNENTIVINVYREDSYTNAPIFDIDVHNSTFNDGANLNIVGGKLKYFKNIIVNVFDDYVSDDPNDPVKSTININPKSPYITVNQFPRNSSTVKNGNKIIIKIEEISSGNTVKIIPSVVE